MAYPWQYLYHGYGYLSDPGSFSIEDEAYEIGDGGDVAYMSGDGTTAYAYKIG